MAFIMDEVWVDKGQLMVTKPNNEPAWMEVKGEDKVLHSSYLEGNIQIGKADVFSEPLASCNIGREDKVGTDRSLFVRGNVAIEGDGDTNAALDITSFSALGCRIRGGAFPLDINNRTAWVDAQGEAFFKVGSGGVTLSTRFGQADNRPKPFDLKHP